MDDNVNPGGKDKRSLRGRAWERVDQAGQNFGQYTGNKMGGAIDSAKQHGGEYQQAGKNVMNYAGRLGLSSVGAKGTGQAAGTSGIQAGGKKTSAQQALNNGENASNNRDAKVTEAVGTAGVTTVAAGTAAVAALAGDEAHAAKIATALFKEFMKDPFGFLKKNLLGGAIIGGIGGMLAAMLIAMVIFIPIFAITHFAETAKNIALKLTTVDEAYNAGRAIISGVGKAGGAVGDILSGVPDTTRAKLAVAGTINNISTEEGSPTSALLAQAASDPSQETTISKLLDQIDFSKILKNLGEEGKLKIYSGGQEVPIEELGTRDLGTVQLRIGGRMLNVPDDPTTPEFLADLTLAIRETDLFAHSSRTLLSEEIKKMYSDNGVVLNRWENNGKDITDYGKNIKSAFTSVSKGNISQAATQLKDIDDASSKVAENATEMLDANPSVGEKNFVKKAVDKSWQEVQGEGGTDSITAFSAGRASQSPAYFTVASYCSAKSFTNEDTYAKIVTQQYKGAVRNGMKVLSASDQIEAGDVRRQSVGAESQRREGYETSRAYLKAISLDVRTRTPDLSEAQLGSLNPNIVFAAMKSVVNLFEEPFGSEVFRGTVSSALGGGGGGFFSGIVDTVTGVVADFLDSAVSILGGNKVLEKIGELLCAGMSNETAGVALQIADQVSKAPGRLGQYGVLTEMKKELEAKNARALIEQLGLNQSGFSKPTEEMMYFMFGSQKALNYAGLDDGVDLASKEFEGAMIFGNELARASGGRPLTPRECAEARGITDQQDIVIRNNKPLLARLFSPEEIKSPVALGLAHVPLSKDGAINKTKLALGGSINPLSSVAAATQKLAYSTTLAGNTAFAQSTSSQFAEDQQLCYGFSVEERERIASDPSFWPERNAQIVEHQILTLPSGNSGDFGDLQQEVGQCYTKPMFELLLDVKTDNTSLNPYQEGGVCSEKTLRKDSALRLRVYKGDVLQFKNLVNMQEITLSGGVAGGGPIAEGTVTIDQTDITKGCGGIRVQKAIIPKVEALCNAAAGAGLQLTGGGWRDSQEQIALREAHCGSSYYAIYEMPSSQCSPPTAKPGKSNHEKGLAIDFRNCSTRSTRCYQWLALNAEGFGFYNLPSEAWHWSVDGN